MADSQDWRGASDKTYNYDINDRGSLPVRDQIGNFIFAKRAGGAWKAIYVGQGNLRDCHQAALNEGCVQLKAATHFHHHLNEIETDRLNEAQDILEGQPDANAPGGCNEARGD